MTPKSTFDNNGNTLKFMYELQHNLQFFKVIDIIVKSGLNSNAAQWNPTLNCYLYEFG